MDFIFIQFITVRICLKGSSAGIVFYSHADFWIFRPRLVAPIKVKFGREELSAPPCQIQTKTLKIWNFTNIITPKGRVPCTILTKFTGFMHILSLQ